MNERDDYLIDGYASNTLKENEKNAFEARLKNEPELAEALDLQMRMYAFLDKKNEKFLQDVKDDFLSEYPPTPISIPLYKRPIFRIGVGIAAAVSLVLIIWQINEPLKPANTSQTAHKRYAVIEQSDGIASNDLIEAAAAFNSGDYTNAANSLDKYLTSTPDDVEALLYKGISLLELGKIKDAKTIFRDISNGDSFFKANALWYLALTHLRENDIVSCKNVLNQLIVQNQDVLLVKKAKLLLKKLK